MDVADFQAGSPIESSSATLKRATDMSSSPPAKKPNLSWKRRKEELLTLRSESEALQTRLMFLKLRRTHAKLLKAGVGLSDEQKRWRDAAESEKRKCRSAQEDNTQLKDQLHRCFKACHDLHMVVAVAGVKQRDLVVANPFVARLLRAELRNGHLLQPSSAVLINLDNRLNARYSELEYLFHHARESILGPDVDQVNVHREGVDGTLAAVEFKRNQFMPFDADKAFRAIWKVMLLGVMPEDENASVFKHSDDTIVSQGCDMRALQGGGTVEVRVTFMVKRVVIPGGFVALIESTSEWRACPAQAKAWTHTTQDSGWALVHPNAPQPGTCQLQLAIRLRTHEPAAAGEKNAPTLLTRVVGDVVIPSFRDILRSRQQLVENVLLDAAGRAEVEVERGYY
ncbi:50S ribosomal protein L1 [Phytophthora cinnamomi]|uniref:50S ribosomal protein L1 n=1 Tax=Phytophthora cinnamomi TaxID=4785 RepID=UPI003559CAF6|nr:50S ribosomal protein L1 [Phytophthora cinnamomi]